MIHPFYKSKNRDFTLVLGDCLEVLGKFDFAFDLVFADPPYFLSSGGISVQAGRRVCVDKGIWDKPRGREAERAFTYAWLKAVRDKLAPDGTIWISGTFHNIFLVAEALEALGFRLLNAVTWQKTNPPPNLSCRCFTHTTDRHLAPPGHRAMGKSQWRQTPYAETARGARSVAFSRHRPQLMGPRPLLRQWHDWRRRERLGTAFPGNRQ